jgi:GNAT superfamily N-acetyltransferase
MKWIVEPAQPQDVAALVDLVIAQEARWHALASLRPARSPEAVASMLVERLQQPGEPPFVARDASGKVRGYLAATLFEFSYDRRSDATSLEVFPERTNFVTNLTLPSPESDELVPVATALLEALQQRGQKQQVQGEFCRWPLFETIPNDALRAAGFEVFMKRAFRPLGPLPASRWPAPADLLVRRARPEDEDMLVDIYLEESEYHHQHSPFFRMTPLLGADFRALVAAGWQGKSVEQGVPLVIVVERAGQVLAMAYTFLVQVEDLANRDYLPLGRYANIAEVGVRSHLRGQGVGRALVQGVFDAYADRQIDGYVLGFSPHNPLSSQFWPHLGFHPFWNLHQRRREQTARSA